MLVMIGLFAFYQSFTKTSVLALDIPFFMLVIIFCALLGFLLAKQDWCRTSTSVWIVIALIITALIIWLTYHPGPGYLFLDDAGLQ